MKIISLFTKAPQHQRFSYRPRYYDPAKDEQTERELRIKKEIDRERGIIQETTGHHSRIAGSFQAARKRSKPTAESSTVVMRLGVLLFIALLIVAYLQWGKPVLYVGAIFIPVYLYMKFKTISRKN
jgi:cytochrome c-type biogenesis protein CcmH/NrfG